MVLIDDEREVAEIITSNSNLKRDYFSGNDWNIIHQFHELGYINITRDGFIRATQKLVEELLW